VSARVLWPCSHQHGGSTVGVMQPDPSGWLVPPLSPVTSHDDESPTATLYSLAGKSIGNEAAELVGHMLLKNATLISLDLSGNMLMTAVRGGPGCSFAPELYCSCTFFCSWLHVLSSVAIHQLLVIAHGFVLTKNMHPQAVLCLLSPPILIWRAGHFKRGAGSHEEHHPHLAQVRARAPSRRSAVPRDDTWSPPPHHSPPPPVTACPKTSSTPWEQRS
jgi:hypothetical protein